MGTNILTTFCVILLSFAVYAQQKMPVLSDSLFKRYIDTFNKNDDEQIVNAISNKNAFKFLSENIPYFECPDSEFEEMYYYRWWTYRKHIKETKEGYVITEFITPVKHAGVYNTISCAAGHHIYEGRWLRNQKYLDDYITFWLRGDEGKPQKHFHKFSGWFADALYNRFQVNCNRQFVVNLLPDLESDFRQWEEERRLGDKLFWQYDVRDGMEESISGSRKDKNARPTINSYMYGNALAISKIAKLNGNMDISAEYNEKAKMIKNLVLNKLWDKNSEFFKVRLENGALSDAREEIGFVPWYFNLPDSNYSIAWTQIKDTTGFKAPFGLTTAERRHPKFRTHGTGSCEWDGAVWPFATSQTLTAMANLIRNYNQNIITRNDYFNSLSTYIRSQHKNGKPYIGEYLDEKNGYWLKGDNPRSSYYNHSTFCDLIITGLAGLVPRADNILEISPLLPENTWEWFAIENINYHGRIISIIWDKSGEKYHIGKGLFIIVDNKLKVHSEILKKVITVL